MAETIYSTRDINKAIRAQIKKGAATRIEGLSGQDSIGVGLKSDAKITIVGEAGDFFGALNTDTTLLLRGSAKRFLGDSFLSGKIVVEGNVGDGVGTNMLGGEITVKGKAGNRVGAGMKGGLIIIDGNVGDDLGLYLFNGDIIITGNAGKNVGSFMTGGSIYVNGSIKSLGENATTEKKDKSDRMKLTNYLTKLNLMGEFTFKKVTSKNEIPYHKIRNSLGLGARRGSNGYLESDDSEMED